MRWNFIIPTAVILALIIIFNIFFFDFYLKKGLIASGQAVFGAKVEIASVKTKFFKCAVNIKGIKIADKNDYFKNLIDVDNINFSARFLPLLSKKFIVNDMTVDGLKWATARKTSGELPKKLESKPSEPDMLDSALTKIKETTQAEYNALPVVKNIENISEQLKNFNPENLMKSAGLNSAQELQNSFNEVQAKYENYSKEISSIDPKAQIDALTKSVTELSQMQVKSVSDIAAVKQKIDEITAQKKELERILGILKNLQKDVNAQKAAFANLNDIINKDIAKVMALANLPSLDFKHVARALFGNTWVNRIDQALYYMQLIRKYIPEKSDDEQKEVAKERIKGKDITYKLKGVLPKFLISNVKVSGTTGGEGKPEPIINFAGTIKNITSNQRLVGAPMSLDLKGDNTKQFFEIKGIFDRLTDIASDRITLSASGLDAAMLNIPETDFTPSFNGAQARAKAEFSLVGTDFSAKVNLNLTGFNVNPEAQKYIVMLWENIHSISINTGISISETGTDFIFNSDIDNKLTEGFKNIFGTAAKDAEAKVRAEVTKQITAQKDNLTAQLKQQQSALTSQITAQTDKINTELKNVTNAITSKQKQTTQKALPTDTLKKLF